MNFLLYMLSFDSNEYELNMKMFNKGNSSISLFEIHQSIKKQIRVTNLI